MGITSTSVYTSADRHSLHVSVADESFFLGESPAAETYLNRNRIIEAALKVGAQAIHPGYGFLSENVEFAEACARNDLIFIGPPASAIHDMGIKSISKQIMSAASVPIVPGYHGDEQSDDFLACEAEKIGYPVMIKAIKGGGGKGMRIAKNSGEFFSQLNSARNEAEKAFGDGSVLIERFVTNPRHVEVQVFADTHGNCVYLFERDCSVQRRHQKIIEEAPAPGLSVEIRKRLGEAAVAAAKAVNYVGAGTVEFIYDQATREFYFMEMNTRIQVEHPITEMITGTDLVEWQIRVARCEKLPLTQEQLSINGHSFEARIYAEDVDNNFMPGAGKLELMSLPPDESGLRIELGVKTGDEVSVFYDPMIAKLVVWSHDRQTALAKLRQALRKFNVAGLTTNVDFLHRLASHREFIDGNVYTDFIRDHHESLIPKSIPIDNHTLAAGALSFSFESGEQRADPFRICGMMEAKRSMNLKYRDENYKVSVTSSGRKIYSLEIGDKKIDNIKATMDSQNDQLRVEIDGLCKVFKTLKHDNHVSLFNVESDSVHFELIVSDQIKSNKIDTGIDGGQSVIAPMPGVIEKILVNEGDNVKSGDPLVVMIAMKMEYVIKATGDDVIEKLPFKVGENVQKGVKLVIFKKN